MVVWRLRAWATPVKAPSAQAVASAISTEWRKVMEKGVCMVVAPGVEGLRTSLVAWPLFDGPDAPRMTTEYDEMRQF
jgi:hypothetical protein